MYCWSIRRGHKTLKAKFVVSCCAFCKVQRNFGFFCSVNHLSRPLRKHMFTCDWCISIHFVCFCVSRLVACDCSVSDDNRLVFFEDFTDLSYFRLLQEQSHVGLLPTTKIRSLSRFSSLILSSLESFSVL